MLRVNGFEWTVEREDFFGVYNSEVMEMFDVPKW
jgi:hypothetical protein